MSDSSIDETVRPARSRIRTLVNWLLLSGITAAIAYGAVFHHKTGKTTKGRTGGFSGPVSVEVDIARMANMDLTLPALGTVDAYNTVTLHSQVDGELRKVHFDEGTAVKAGDLLLEIDPRPFEVQKSEAQAQLARDSALLENARLDLERFNILLTQDSIPKQQVDTQAALVRQYEASLKVDEAQIAAADLQLDHCRITSPITGRIGLRTVDEGNVIHANDVNGIAVITQVQPINAIFSIPQDAIPNIARQMATPEPILAEAFDRDGTTLLARGKVVTLDNQIDTSTGTVRMMAEFPNADGRLFPNQFVNIILTVEHLKDVIVIPSAAVQHGTSGTYVYVVAGGKTVSLRPVETGPSEKGMTRISKGISPDETIVVDGIDKLREGAQVRIVDPAGTPSPKAKGKN